MTDLTDQQIPRQRKGLNPFLPDAPVRTTFTDEGVRGRVLSWRDAEREKEAWRDGDTNTYRYRANLLEAAVIRWQAIEARAQKAEAENKYLIADRTANEKANIASRRSICEQRDRHLKKLHAVETRLAAVETLMAATITPSGGEGCVTVAHLRAALAADTTPEPTEPHQPARLPGCIWPVCSCAMGALPQCGLHSAIPEQEAGNDE